MSFLSRYGATILVAAGFMVFLAGCATTFVPPKKAKLAGADRIYAPKSMLHPFPGCSVLIVTRGAGTMTGSAVRIGFDIDGKPAASIWPGEKSRFYLHPGAHMLTFDHPGFRGGKQIYTTLGEATIYSISTGALGGGGFRIVPKTAPNQAMLAKECQKHTPEP